jgi:phosphoribosyl 1,2-cyclic phosphate phosphodiesterase
MQLTFLGTGADSAYPLPFCVCAICQRARATGGKNIRRRSSAIVNQNLLIDLGPDSVSSLLTCGLDPSQLRYLLQTHPHHDHFDQNHLLTRTAEYAL